MRASSHRGGRLHPTDLDVIPRRWVWHHTTGELIALMPSVPYRDAACVNREDLFLADRIREGSDELNEAKNICAACPIKKACNAWAMAHEDFGIWAGKTALDRRAERKRIGLRVMEPVEAATYNLGDDLHQKTQLPPTCKKGHHLKPIYDSELDRKASSSHRQVYKVKCSTCYYENHESPEAKAEMVRRGALGAQAIDERGTRNTGRRNKFGG